MAEQTPDERARRCLAAAEAVRQAVLDLDDDAPPARTPPPSAYRNLRNPAARRAWLDQAAKTLRTDLDNGQ
jgi:hypothetical protein